MTTSKSRIKRLMVQSSEMRELVEALRQAVAAANYRDPEQSLEHLHAKEVLAKYEECKT